MSGKHDFDLASAFSLPVEIVPFIPDLLADLWALGVPPGIVVEILRPLNLQPQSTRVLDLGCGKGAVSITLARELGFMVDGVDFFPPFIREARIRADNLNLGGTCRFREGDIRKAGKKGAQYDVAMLIWVGGALGSPAESVGKLRRVVHPGGYMVYAEGYLKDTVRADDDCDQTAHGGRLGHEEILRSLTGHGDEIMRETIIPEDQTRSLYADYTGALRNGARRITGEHPEYEGILENHIKAQERTCRMLERYIVPAVWLLRKASP